MQLTYRGNHYTPCHQVEASASVELTYRGVNYRKNGSKTPSFSKAEDGLTLLLT